MKGKNNQQSRRTAKTRGKQRVVAPQRRDGALAGKPRAPKKKGKERRGAKKKNKNQPP